MTTPAPTGRVMDARTAPFGLPDMQNVKRPQRPSAPVMPPASGFTSSGHTSLALGILNGRAGLRTAGRGI